MIAVLFAVACSTPEEVAPVVANGLLSPDLTQGPAASAWSGKPNAGSASAQAATVNGVGIDLAEVKLVMAAHPELSAKAALDTLITTELLAQASVWGVGAGAGRDEPAERFRPWREALAQRYLRNIFESETHAEAIPFEEIKRVYWVPSVRKQYDHTDAWQMAHLFFTCCDPKVETCDTPEIMACFEDAGRTIQEVYAEVKSRTESVEGSPEAVKDLMEAYRLEMENALPQLAFRTRPFYYDPKKTHDAQKGFNLLAEAVARTVVDAPLAVIQEPVQSPFGWHVLVQLDHVPESRRGLDDAGVVSDIRQNLMPRFRRSQFARRVGELRARYAVKIRPESLPAIGGGGSERVGEP
jgi:hypothetical protein